MTNSTGKATSIMVRKLNVSTAKPVNAAGAKRERCECDPKAPRGWKCTQKIIRCQARLDWARKNDPVFRRVWGLA